MEDNPYIVQLEPDEFHELLSAYEDFYEQFGKSVSPEQKALSERVLNKLHEADVTHVCVDEFGETEQAGEEDGLTGME